MCIEIFAINGVNIAELFSEGVEINDSQDALDLMANCRHRGAEKIIIQEKNIVPDFFDLKTGILGEVLQKFSTYRVQLAIVGNFAKFNSKSLRDFMYESNKGGHIIFVSSVAEAKKKLSL